MLSDCVEWRIQICMALQTKHGMQIYCEHIHGFVIKHELISMCVDFSAANEEYILQLIYFSNHTNSEQSQ